MGISAPNRGEAAHDRPQDHTGHDALHALAQGWANVCVQSLHAGTLRLLVQAGWAGQASPRSSAQSEPPLQMESLGACAPTPTSIHLPCIYVCIPASRKDQLQNSSI